ncbi:hypothetical protein FQN50_005785 [Emmonsiellopsis sp. PD_5]|nr:hypothetical protein FQN50_005785 [Emmonsiellopsis sp. PD_5]
MAAVASLGRSVRCSLNSKGGFGLYPGDQEVGERKEDTTQEAVDMKMKEDILGALAIAKDTTRIYDIGPLHRESDKQMRRPACQPKLCGESDQ